MGSTPTISTVRTVLTRYNERDPVFNKVRRFVSISVIAFAIMLLGGFVNTQLASAHSSGYVCYYGSAYYVTYDAKPIQPYWAGNHTHTITSWTPLYYTC